MPLIAEVNGIQADYKNGQPNDTGILDNRGTAIEQYDYGRGQQDIDGDEIEEVFEVEGLEVYKDLILLIIVDRFEQLILIEVRDRYKGV